MASENSTYNTTTSSHSNQACENNGGTEIKGSELDPNRVNQSGHQSTPLMSSTSPQQNLNNIAMGQSDVTDLCDYADQPNQEDRETTVVVLPDSTGLQLQSHGNVDVKREDSRDGQGAVNSQSNQEDIENAGPSSYNTVQNKSQSHQLEFEAELSPQNLSEPVIQMAEPQTLDSTDDVIDSRLKSPSVEICSMATLENARYSVSSLPFSDHPNEDRHFAIEGDHFSVWCVLDGHNGSRAAEFASKYLMEKFMQPSWKKIVEQADEKIICQALHELFLDAEKEFFASMETYVKQKKELQEKIPPDLTSYAAYMLYPYEVQQLQEIEPMLEGGCTVVLAVVINNVLYIANVGDSRALLVCEVSKGTLITEQLSVDHTVENEVELKRLESLGLCRNDLKKAGRLGTQENTRSIGDYSIKEGYKDIDSLALATSPPGIAVPFLTGQRKLDDTCKYLILMTDGVYKTIESTFSPSLPLNNVVVQVILSELNKVQSFEHLSTNTLEKIKEDNENTYMMNAKKDVRSPLAVACRKRDDMTLIVHKF